MSACIISPRTPGATWDNSIVRSITPYAPPVLVTADMLPLFCGEMTDMGRDQACRRVGQVYSLHAGLTEITDARKRHARLRSELAKRNLSGWIAFAERRLTHELTDWALAPCTCSPERRFDSPVSDMELVLPVCTC